jgi:enamine deaminase RidA (YjgF/YER057c/UK114 family)
MQALRNIELALQQVGANRTHVVRTRIFVADHKTAEAITRAQMEFFGKPLPPTSITESPLLGSEALVEIEAEAVLS